MAGCRGLPDMGMLHRTIQDRATSGRMAYVPDLVTRAAYRGLGRTAKPSAAQHEGAGAKTGARVRAQRSCANFV